MSDKMASYFSSVGDYFKDKPSTPIIRCKLCGSKESEKYTKSTSRCIDCKFVWRSYQPTKKVLTAFYENSPAMSAWSDIKKTYSETKRQNHKFKPIWDYIAGNPKVGSVLDVGSGNGFFLEHTTNRVEKMGVEPNLAVPPQGYKVVKTKEEIGEKKFDLISFFGVVEHLPAPYRELKYYVERHLTYDGKIAIIVPNVDSLIVKLAGDKCATFCPQHLWYFNRDTLGALMAELGFKYELYTTAESEAKAVLRYMKTEDPYNKSINPLIWGSFEMGILTQGLGYKIVAVFSRSGGENEPEALLYNPGESGIKRD